MKKIYSLALTSLLIVAAWGQSPQKISYQAVIRNAANNLVVNQLVGMRISILQGSATGTPVYTETQTRTSNANGLVTLEIGAGTTSDSFSAINWAAGPYFVKVDSDPTGGTGYSISGVSQLLSVPYALYAKNVENNNDADADPTNEIQVLSLSGNNLSLSKGGGMVALPASPGLALPFSASASYATTPFSIENTGSALYSIAGYSNTGYGIFGKTKALNGAGVYGWGTGNDYSAGICGASGEAYSNAIPGNAGVLGLSDAHLAVAGTSISGTGGYFSSTSGNALSTNGKIRMTGIGEAAGRVLTCDAGGQASWQNAPTGGGLTLPYAGTIANESVAFQVTNTGFSAIKGISTAVGIGNTVGVTGESHTSGGSGVSGTGDYCGVSASGAVYGVLAMATGARSLGIYANSSAGDGWAGWFGGRVCITGNLGVGVESPGYKLDVSGSINLDHTMSGGPVILCNGSEALWYNGTYFSWGYGGSWNFFGDKVFIGPAASDPGSNMLVVNGTAAKPGGGSWSTWSDSRLKDIHGKYEKGLTDIVELEPVRFSYKQGNACKLPSDQNYVGFVAQDVQKVFPEAVREEKDGYLSLDIHSINVALVNAVKELKAENDRLKMENDRINSRLDKLEKKIGN